MLHKSVVLFGSTFRQGLEPVRIVSDTHFHSPLLHAGSYGISDGAVQTGPVVHHVNHLVVYILGQVFIHLLAVEDILAEIR